IYSLNLLSPFWPQRNSGLLMQRDSNVASDLAPIIDATGGQYEGYAYLGLGVLALLVIALVLAPNRLWQLVRGNAALVAAMALVIVFSASNHVYWGDHRLISYEYPALFEKVANQFR